MNPRSRNAQHDISMVPVTGNTPETQPENRTFYPALDGLRALAFMMVFSTHYMGLSWMWAGVDLFFVLSGFLITGILFDTQDAPNRFSAFYARRTLRIFPLYYGLFLILLLVTPIAGWHWSASWLAWPLYVGNYLRFWHPYIANTPWQRVADAQLANPRPVIYLGHLWSLCVEEQFYLVWPFVVFFVRSRARLIWICVGSVVLVPWLRVLVQHHATANMLGAEVLYRVTPFRVDALLIGGLAALWYRGRQRTGMLRASHWAFWACTAVAVTYVGLGMRLGWNYASPTWKFTWGLCFIDFYAVAMVVVALQPGSVIYRIFALAPLRWLGRISYGAYVFHDIYHGVVGDHVYFFLLRFKHPELTPTYTAIVAFPLTVGLAALSFYFYETPFLRLKRRWTVRGVRTGS